MPFLVRLLFFLLGISQLAGVVLIPMKLAVYNVGTTRRLRSVGSPYRIECIGTSGKTSFVEG